MPPSGGHQLVPVAWNAIRTVLKKTSNMARVKLLLATRPLRAELEPVLIRNNPVRHPVHRAAFIRQSKGRWYTTHSAINATVRRFTSAATRSVKRVDGKLPPASAIGSAVSRQTLRTPFASTLRPNLTGGALPRTAGGYSIGGGRVGGARYFSHTPAAPAQVVNNVSSAVRAFWHSGSKAHYCGVDSRSGEKQFRAITALQDETERKMSSLPKAAPGSFIDFQLSPTITAIGPLSRGSPAQAQTHDDSLKSDGLLEMLSVDFSRSLQDLSAVLNDLKRISTLGDLPITLPKPATLRVHFPGCDARSVENLCDELGVQRGIIRQDGDFDVYAGTTMALRFPFAPSHAVSEASSVDGYDERYFEPERVDWENMISPSSTVTSHGFSHNSGSPLEFDDLDGSIQENPWTRSPSGYSSLHSSEGDETSSYFFEQPRLKSNKSKSVKDSSEYEGVEGIYRFLEQCDSARR
ncbi:DNA repair protein RAD51 [Xylona heveae TC161]|uniref:DNA repair protein RAD51 n=1 Tax=Xylona heveae (strain CBS 132557 / TC161) TaxID=1328760 RepID=A0A164Z8N5_XYLHT|nr:DNA repair protein RAD51 [Xylona heveae TC161]KZF18820.1 DNA repair protein RAD51 [Xylona heveae TC161]